MEQQSQPTEISQAVSSDQSKTYIIASSIVLAGAMIAGAVLYSTGAGRTNGGVVAGPVGDLSVDERAALANARSVSDSDHIRGNREASVVVVEYSDFDCPFCQQFHATMQQVVNDYQGKVAWVYRQFPLDTLHPDARRKAEASECAAELGGNEKFWQFADLMFDADEEEVRRADLAAVAGKVGINAASFNACLTSKRHAERVQEDVENAMSTGGGGTPFSVVITKSGKRLAIPGALPLPQTKSIIDRALAEE